MCDARMKEIIESCYSDYNDFWKRAQVSVQALPNVKSFWSKIFLVKVSIDGEKDYPKELFVKLPHLTDNLDKVEDKEERPEDSTEHTLKVFSEREAQFYAALGDVTIPNFPVPKTYYVKPFTGPNTGGLAAENLSKNVYSVEYIPGFSENQVKSLMEAIAGFHFKVLETPGKIEQYDWSSVNQDADFFDLMFSEATVIQDLKPSLFKNRISKLKKYFSKDYFLRVAEQPKRRRIPSVLVHGDLNVSNILWRKDSSDGDLAAIIDFQTVHSASVAHDIINILVLGVSRGERRKNEKSYLEHYYNTLSGFYKSGVAPFTIEQLHSTYREVFASATNFQFFGLAVYCKLYSSGILGNSETKQECIDELCDRALGIVEDIEMYAQEFPY